MIVVSCMIIVNMVVEMGGKMGYVNFKGLQFDYDFEVVFLEMDVQYVQMLEFDV